MCLHMQTQLAAEYLERLAVSLWPSVFQDPQLLFSFLAWGELAQVELMDLKVVEWLVKVGERGREGNCPGGKCAC